LCGHKGLNICTEALWSDRVVTTLGEMKYTIRNMSSSFREQVKVLSLLFRIAGGQLFL